MQSPPAANGGGRLGFARRHPRTTFAVTALLAASYAYTDYKVEGAVVGATLATTFGLVVATVLTLLIRWKKPPRMPIAVEQAPPAETHLAAPPITAAITSGDRDAPERMMRARAVYADVVSADGDAVFTDAARLRSTFADRASGAFKRERAALVVATNFGVAALLRAAPGAPGGDATVARVAHSLVENTAIDARLAHWAVATIAAALEKRSDDAGTPCA